MKNREPWLGLLTVAGLTAMLLGEGLVDVAGLAVAVVPLAYGGLAWRRARRPS
ncbi:hypothetical protein OV203_25675 [Nannocystis sp. ILAH1]|uniref:hypothetical protein n=1 Tax=unclassified Nannocystis TaxID=2627009 RepID=UPI0022713BAE|nr:MULTISPECIES: hypothetical protein [unclassified Nannocystis]MCY0990558.1 hypothetical protein [Nannocystis sp. ILAH1]MCY1072128.1 hypothetical protein [Nannocystis sp. RBIL2]